MQPFAAGCLRPWLEAFGLEKLSEAERRFDHEVPLDALAGIKVEDHLIRVLDVVDCRAPRMQFDRIHVDEPEESLEIVDPQPDASTALAFLDMQFMNPGCRRRKRAAMVERGVMRVPHELERA